MKVRQVFIIGAFVWLGLGKVLGQVVSVDLERGIFNADTSFTSARVFNYFTSEWNPLVYEVGSLFLMSSDSVSFVGPNQYQYLVSSKGHDGLLEIFFKNHLLFQFRLKNGRINGEGLCYYPFESRVALRGEFQNGMLNGLVFVLSSNGRPVEVIRFKQGIYKCHEFRWNVSTKIGLKRISRNRSSNPLRNDETVIR